MRTGIDACSPNITFIYPTPERDRRNHLDPVHKSMGNHADAGDDTSDTHKVYSTISGPADLPLL